MKANGTGDVIWYQMVPSYEVMIRELQLSIVFFPKTLYHNFSEVLGGIKSKCMFNLPLYPEIRYSLKGNMPGYQKKKKKK